MEVNSEEAQPQVFLDRASRATRGKRMTKLLDEEIEEDNVFWNQDALKEEVDDVEYEKEGEVADVFDSDFDEDEPEADEEVQNKPDERIRTKKRLIYPGKQPPKTKKIKMKTNKVLLEPDNSYKDEIAPEDLTPSEHHMMLLMMPRQRK